MRSATETGGAGGAAKKVWSMPRVILATVRHSEGGTSPGFPIDGKASATTTIGS
jgi:hypothetical protein